MFLKLAYLFQEHQISAGQLSAYSSLTETLYFLNRIGPFSLRYTIICSVLLSNVFTNQTLIYSGIHSA